MKKQLSIIGLSLLLCICSCSANTNSSSQTKPDQGTTTEKKYTVTWKNWDGSTLEVDKKVSKSRMPSYDGPTPTKERGCVYKPHDSIPNYYTAISGEYDFTFKGWGLEYDDSRDHQKDYYSTASTCTLQPVSENITYYARFSYELTSYTVMFDSDGGTPVASQTVKYGQYAKRPEDPKKDHYKFFRWYFNEAKQEFPFERYNITEDITLTAAWLPESYYIDIKENLSSSYYYTYLTSGASSEERFNNNSSEYYKSLSYDENGITIIAPSLKSRTFKGWYELDKTSFDNIKTGTNQPIPEGSSLLSTSSTYTFVLDKDTYLYAVWESNQFNVTLDPNGGTCSTTTVDVTFSEHYELPTPEREGYRFMGWYYGTNKVENSGSWKYGENITLVAEWEKELSVVFEDWDGTVLHRSIYLEGETPRYPSYDPKRKGNEYDTYTFIGWLPELGPIYEDTTYVAQYERTDTEFIAKFVNYDNTVLQRKSYKYNETPVYTGETPTKPDSSNGNKFIFTGWSPKIRPIERDTTYVAQFEELTPFNLALSKIESNWTEVNTTATITGVAFSERITYDNKRFDMCLDSSILANGVSQPIRTERHYIVSLDLSEYETKGRYLIEFGDTYTSFNQYDISLKYDNRSAIGSGYIDGYYELGEKDGETGTGISLTFSEKSGNAYDSDSAESRRCGICLERLLRELKKYLPQKCSVNMSDIGFVNI